MTVITKENMTNVFKPVFQINHNQEKIYRIRTTNMHLNSVGSIFKLQNMDADYQTKTIVMKKGAIVNTLFQWGDIKFSDVIKNKKTGPIIWNFAKGRKFAAYLLLSYENLKSIKESDGFNISENNFGDCFHSIEEAYKDMPKLPSVNLLFMKTIDAVTFECYLSYIYTEAEKNNGWEIDKWIEIIPAELNYARGVDMSFGLYENNSLFINKKLYMKFTGYTLIDKKLCAVFDYYCDSSKVNIRNKENGHYRNGTSYYHGQLWVNIFEGDLERATLDESYIGKHMGEKEIPIYVRRKILCEKTSK